MYKTRVGIFRGGLSDEYSVSLNTGAMVLESIDRNKFYPIDIVITKSGEWLTDGYTRYPECLLPTIDVAFIALHGTYGEDGTIQRLFDRFAIPYTGSKAMPSGVAMNKALTKSVLKDTGIKMPPHLTVSRGSKDNVARIAERITDMYGTQYFIKPVSSGSSVGTMMVKNPSLLPQALSDALENFEEVMVEPRIVGREATCGVIERYRNAPLYALPPIEIVPPPDAGFFDSNAKYSDCTDEICPGRFTFAVKQDLESIAKQVHTHLGLSQYSRSDFIVADDGIYFLEVNTLPGLTKVSLFPKAIMAVGGTYTEFITHLLTDVLEHHSR